MIRSFEFSKFLQKGEAGGVGFVQIFTIKSEGLVKQEEGGVSKKRVPLIFVLTNPSQCYLSLSVWCVFMFCLLDLIWKYTLPISEEFLKRKDIELFIQCNTNSCCRHIISLLAPECALCLCVFVCVCVCVCVCVFVYVVSNQSTSKKQHYVSDLSKLDFFGIKHASKSLKY